MAEEFNPFAFGGYTTNNEEFIYDVTADDSVDYEFVHNQELIEGEHGEKRIEPLPSEDFPGTWNAAFNETKKAAKEVGKATQSYAGAIAGSGIGKAGYAIGKAVAKTAERNALVVAELAVQASGRENQLPGPLREMLQRKRQVDEARRRAQTRIEEAKQAPKGLIAWGIQAIASRLPFTITYTETSTHQSSDDDDDGFLLVGGPDGGYPPGSRYDGFNNLEEVHAFSDDERSNKE